MSVFDHPEFDQHECVHFVQDERSGLRAIIAVHNTVRGPALGGCRMWPYASSADALTDVLRLSRGMTYKSAMANIDLGGGKSVIIGDPRQVKTDALIRAMGQAVDRLGGLYVAAEDSGTSVDDLRRMGEVTSHVGGVIERHMISIGFLEGEGKVQCRCQAIMHTEEKFLSVHPNLHRCRSCKRTQ